MQQNNSFLAQPWSSVAALVSSSIVVVRLISVLLPNLWFKAELWLLPLLSSFAFFTAVVNQRRTKSGINWLTFVLAGAVLIGYALFFSLGLNHDNSAGGILVTP